MVDYSISQLYKPHTEDFRLTRFSFSFAHAQFVWDCKSEPKVRETFAKIWGTDKLTVSYGMACYDLLCRKCCC